MTRTAIILTLLLQSTLTYSQVEQPLDLSPVGAFLKLHLIDSSSMYLHAHASVGGSKMMRTFRFKPEFANSYPANMAFSGDVRLQIVPDNSSNYTRRLVVEQGLGYSYYKGRPDQWRITGYPNGWYSEPSAEIAGFQQLHALYALTMIGVEFGMRNSKIGVLAVSDNHVVVNAQALNRVKRIVPYLGLSLRYIPPSILPITSVEINLKRTIKDISTDNLSMRNYMVTIGLNLRLLTLKS